MKVWVAFKDGKPGYTSEESEEDAWKMVMTATKKDRKTLEELDWMVCKVTFMQGLKGRM